MRSCLCKITTRSCKKMFLLICICCVCLLLFYFYGEKYDIFMDLAMSRVRLNPNTFKNATRIQPPEVCFLSKLHEPETALLFILSAPNNGLRRQVIRSSWAQRKVMSRLRFGVVFIVGEASDNHTAVQNDLEAEMFGDIVRTHVIDSYLHLVHKTMVGLQWVLDHCPASKIIIKADDDVFINPFALRRLLQKLPSLSSKYDSSISESIGEKKSSVFTIGTAVKNVDLHKENSLPNYFEGGFRAQNNRPFSSSARFFSKRIGARHGMTIRDLKFVIPPEKSSTNSEIYVKDTPLALNTEPPKGNVKNMGQEDTLSVQCCRTLYCLVWRNMSVIRDSNSKWSVSEDRFRDEVYPTYCAGAAYILHISTAELLVEAHKSRKPGDVLPIEDVYVTGILAKDAGVGHTNIGTRYAFKSRNIEAIAKGDIIFAHLGGDMEVLTYFIWNHVEEEQQKIYATTV